MLNNFFFGEVGNDIMLNIATLYKESSIILLMIMYIVLAIILFIIENFNHEENKFPIYFSKKAESTLDIIFVMFPTLVVAYLILPAVGFLYNTEYIMSQVETLFDVSIIGHQWYWSYEYNINICNEYILKILGDEFIHEKLTFDSLINLNSIDARLLSVDKKLILPSNTFINLMITSEDVIHSWALPQFGIKVDAVPGRIAEYVFFSNFNGIYYGQCSELCGVNHGFMPISVETVPYLEFLDFLLISLNFNPSILILELNKLNPVDLEYEEGDDNKNKGKDKNKDEDVNKHIVVNKDKDKEEIDNEKIDEVDLSTKKDKEDEKGNDEIIKNNETIENNEDKKGKEIIEDNENKKNREIIEDNEDGKDREIVENNEKKEEKKIIENNEDEKEIENNEDKKGKEIIENDEDKKNEIEKKKNKEETEVIDDEIKNEEIKEE